MVLVRNEYAFIVGIEAALGAVICSCIPVQVSGPGGFFYLLHNCIFCEKEVMKMKHLEWVIMVIFLLVGSFLFGLSFSVKGLWAPGIMCVVVAGAIASFRALKTRNNG